MNPNALLGRIRATVSRAKREQFILPAEAMELVELVDSLDQKLSLREPLPVAWLR